MTDVRLYHTQDGGEVDVTNGQFVMSDGLETAAYLSLFGGPERYDGLAATSKYEWWGDKGELEEDRKYRSETQNLLRTLPVTSSNLRRVEDAAKRDLAWFTEEVADSIEVSASMPALNRVKLDVVIVIGGKRIGMVFAADWRARAP